jgi:hypothetical protein
MEIYNYNIFTKEFINSEEADVDPLDPNNLLIPASATDKLPLPNKENYYVCYNELDETWEYVPIKKFIYMIKTITMLF